MSTTAGFEQAVTALVEYLTRYVQRKAVFPDHPECSPLRARRLLDLLGRPDLDLSVIRIIGTKGKGSTAAMLEACLRAAGHRTGLYTSPHLHSPRERICVNGLPISPPALTCWLRRILPLLEESLSWADLGPATLFEALTASAMAHFSSRGVELAVVEAGMGGRSDATHAIIPTLTLLTPFSLDHQMYLGNCLEEIAREKVAGVPPGGVALSAPQPAVAWATIAAYCRETGARVRLVDPQKGIGEPGLAGLPSLAGPHQQINAALVLSAVQALREEGWTIPEQAVPSGLHSVRWPGRLEIVAGRPLTVVDAAHNPASAQALATALARYRFRPRVILLGCSLDKDIAGIVESLAPLAHAAVVTKARHYRAAEPRELAALWRERNVPVKTAHETGPALRHARLLAGTDGLVCVCGSFFIVAEAREALGLAVREPWPEPIGLAKT